MTKEIEVEETPQSHILEGIVVAPLDPEKVQETIDAIMELMSQNDVLFSDAFKRLTELQSYITAWETNRNSLHEVMSRIGMPLTEITPAEGEDA